MFTSEVAFSSSNLSRSSGRLLRAQQQESPHGGGSWGGRADRPALWAIFIGRSVRSLWRGCFIFRHCCAQPAVGLLECSHAEVEALKLIIMDCCEPYMVKQLGSFRPVGFALCKV